LSDDFDAVRDVDAVCEGDAVRDGEVAARDAGAVVAVVEVARERVRAPGAEGLAGAARLSNSSMTLQSTSTLARGWRSCCWAFASPMRQAVARPIIHARRRKRRFSRWVCR
jgi:hypothetical protein